MKETTITVSEAARNLTDCVERAHSENMTFVLVKNGVPRARLVPENGRRCTGRELALALGKVSLSTEEARAWHEELHAAREILQPPTGQWQ